MSLIQHDCVLIKRGNLSKGIQEEHHVKVKAEIEVITSISQGRQGKEHRILPAKRQELGQRLGTEPFHPHGTQKESTRWHFFWTSGLQNHEILNFWSHQFVALCYVSPSKVIDSPNSCWWLEGREQQLFAIPNIVATSDLRRWAESGVYISPGNLNIPCRLAMGWKGGEESWRRGCRSVAKMTVLIQRS